MKTLVLTGAAGVLFMTTTASAEIYTFWKTNVCPLDPRTNVNDPVLLFAGKMEAAIDNDRADPGSVEGAGGVFCVEVGASVGPPGLGTKSNFVYNGDVVVNPTDPLAISDPSYIGRAWDCAVCLYDDRVLFKGPGIPALSTLGTAMLLGGLMTGAIYRIRQKQRNVAL
jgi:hypothetical protein